MRRVHSRRITEFPTENACQEKWYDERDRSVSCSGGIFYRQQRTGRLVRPVQSWIKLWQLRRRAELLCSGRSQLLCTGSLLCPGLRADLLCTRSL